MTYCDISLKSEVNLPHEVSAGNHDKQRYFPAEQNN